MLNRYKPLQKLGEGAFATVRLYQHSKSQKKYAVKKMNFQRLRSKKFGNSGITAADTTIEEMRVLKQLQHPNLIWLHEIIDEKENGNIYIVTEYYPNGSLADEVERQNSNGGVKGLQSWQVRFYFLDMLKALYYCHKVVGVVHRDIKPANIMLG